MKVSISGRVEESILKDAKTAAKMEDRSFNNFLEVSLKNNSKRVLKAVKKVNFYKYLENAVVETFAGDTYTCTDYSNEDDFIYFDYNESKDQFRIGDTSFLFDENMTKALWSKFKESEVYPNKE